MRQTGKPGGVSAVFLLYRKLLSCIVKNAPRGCALRRTMQMSQATAAGARMCQGTFFVLGKNRPMKSVPVCSERKQEYSVKRGYRNDEQSADACAGI